MVDLWPRPSRVWGPVQHHLHPPQGGGGMQGDVGERGGGGMGGDFGEGGGQGG